MEALLSNEFVVLALDALLHLASVFVLGVVVVLACKLLSKGFVDAKILTGLTIALLLVFVRVFLLNNIHYALGGMDFVIIMGAIALVLFLSSFILVYKLIAIPVLGSTLSSIAIVSAQLALAHYTPILSLKLMPEGQRFAEYAGIANERTELLMEKAKAFRGQSGSLEEIVRRALQSLAFLTSEEEQDSLSRDFASGINLIKERKAYMDSLSEEELAEYRAAMGQFLEEQGLAGIQNRYSLSNLESAKPEDLENLVSFMQEMNKEYGFTNDITVLDDGNELPPPSAESLMEIAKNLRGMSLSDERNEELLGILSSIFDEEDFNKGTAEARSQLDDLRANSGEPMGNFSSSDLDSIRMKLKSASGTMKGLRGINLNPDMPAYPKFSELPERAEPRFFPLASNFQPLEDWRDFYKKSIDRELLDIVIFEETGYYPTSDTFSPSPATSPADNLMQAPGAIPNLSSRISELRTASTLGAYSLLSGMETRTESGLDRAIEQDVSYYLPISEFDSFPTPDFSAPEIEQPDAEAQPALIDVDHNYFKKSELDSKLTKDYVLRVPRDEDEGLLWMTASQHIQVGAWFEDTSDDSQGTVFIEGVAYRSGETIIREVNGKNYIFQFEGIIEEQIVITALKREPTSTPD